MMEQNKYAVAGWLAVVQAIIMPVSIIMAVVEEGVAKGLLHIRRPFIGPSDLLMVIFTAIAVYTLLMFKRLLNEHYGYRDLDLLIYISIWWAIVFEAIDLLLTYLVMTMWPVNEMAVAIVFIVFMVGAMVTIGIVDILIAVKLLRVREHFSEYVRAFAYVSIVAGICEVTVLLSPVALLLVPVTCVILALIFFRDRHEVEYV